ncbi:MAG: T9SS type A sorting domain-containing protein, partial [Flavobacteriaceae bacterium]|nr:T9SS type A sorting domain-containing protein [Flavobacteriaceae bacterium]
SMDGAIAEAYMHMYEGPGTGDGNGQGQNTRVQQNLVIQTIPFHNPRVRIPIVFSLEQEMSIEVKAAQEINVPYVDAYLFDSDNNTFEQISDGETATKTLAPGLYENRFYITFRAANQEQNPYEVIEIDDLLAKEQELFKQNVAFVQNNPIAELQVSNPEGYDVKELSIYDMSGKLVLAKQNLGAQRSLRFHTGNFADGVYLVRLTTVDNLKVDYKINVFNK